MLTDNPTAPLILVVEDDDNHAELIQRSFDDGQDEYRLEFVGTLRDAKTATERLSPSLILTDYRLPDGYGSELVVMAAGSWPVIMMTSQGNEQFAVETMKSGAQDYIVKSPEAFKNLHRAAKYALMEWALKSAAKQAADAALRAKKDWERTFDAVPDLIAIIDNNHTITRVNKAMADRSGLTPQELIGRKCHEVMHGISNPHASCPHARMMQDEFGHSEQVEEQRLTGVFDVTVSPLYDDDGQIIACVHVARDITERTREEGKLRQSEQALKEAQRIAKFGSWSLDIPDRHLLWSDEIYQIFEIDPLEFVASYEAFLEYIHPDDLDAVNLAYTESLRNKTPYEIMHRLRMKDGRVKHVHERCETSYGSAGQPLRSNGTVQDVTERKRADEYRDMGREVLRILNEPEKMQDSIKQIITALKTRTGFEAVAIRMQDGDDYTYFAQQGFPDDFLLTENTLIERAVDGGVCRDKDGNVSLKCICGLVISGKADPVHPFFTAGGSFWTNDSLPLLDIPPDKDPRSRPSNECIHQGYASFALVPIRDKNKIVGLIQFNDRRKGCFTLDTVELLEGIASHIGAAVMRKRAEEEKVKLEAQFQQAQKLESLGVLAGGIAHDFNNILTIILGHCHIVKEEFDCGMTDKDHVQQIEIAGNRAADLCRQMLAYAGQRPQVQTWVNLPQLVDEVVKMLQSAIKKNVTIELALNRDLAEITGDNAQIQQVVMNLIINAGEAIGEKNGTIKVALKKTMIQAGQSDTDFIGNAIPAGGYACLEVSDTGCGIDEKSQKRIFEPFFTTKFTGRGLGMSAVLGIVKSHVGALQLTSTPGVGTTFTVFFPLSAVPDIVEAAPTAGLFPFVKARGTILLVDDEAALRAIGSALLNAMGFSTITASNGREALRIYSERGSGIDLVLLDMIMPEMGGLETYRFLREVSPAVPIVICSGYNVEEIGEDIDNDELAAAIQKPYQPDQLRNTLMQLLDKKGPAFR
jgi:PAS domain S-box-containing protein